MNNVDKQYLDLCHHILENGVAKTDRTGTGTLSTFGYQMRFDLNEGFPLLTTKKMFWRGVVGELIHTLGDAYIYTNHIEQVKTQIEREPRGLPTLKIKRNVSDIDDFIFDDFEIIGYDPHPHIAGKVAV